MLEPNFTASVRLPDLSRFVYGTTRLGDSSIPFQNRVELAKKAMAAGVSLHTSHTYGDALQVLGEAFNFDRSKIPPFIVKIGSDSVQQITDSILPNLVPMGVTHLPIGQLCLGAGMANELSSGGAICDRLRQLKDFGIVGRFVREVWPWTSEATAESIRNGHVDNLVDGYIFYLNPLQRFVSQDLWELLTVRGETIVAMRTTSGGSIDSIAAHGPEYLRARAEQIRPLFMRSGCDSWPDFCASFALGYSNVVSTVGATARPTHLDELIASVQNAKQLEPDVRAGIEELQRSWYLEHDQHAEPWSM